MYPCSFLLLLLLLLHCNDTKLNRLIHVVTSGSCYGAQPGHCCNTCDDVEKASNSCLVNHIPFHKQEIPQCGGTK